MWLRHHINICNGIKYKAFIQTLSKYFHPIFASHFPLYQPQNSLEGSYYWHQYNTSHPACHIAASRRKKLHEMHLRYTANIFWTLTILNVCIGLVWKRQKLDLRRGLRDMVKHYSCEFHTPLQGILDAICDTWRAENFIMVHWLLMTSIEIEVCGHIAYCYILKIFIYAYLDINVVW